MKTVEVWTLKARTPCKDFVGPWERYRPASRNFMAT